MIDAIYNRRSIRKYKTDPIPQEDILAILESGLKAPSSKNRQPWKYVVIQGQSKKEMLDVFRRGIEREEHMTALLPESKMHIKAAKYTVDIMENTPVIVFVVNTQGSGLSEQMTPEEHIYEICNVQSISASIQNMLLTATERGIGSLWICDIYFAYEELCQWLGDEGQLLAAIAFGYPDEQPNARPRKALDEVVEWRN